MNFDKIKKALELAKASLETKKIPKVDDKKLHESRDKKMLTDKHMNGKNVEQYNYEGEKMLDLEVERISKNENGQWSLEKSNYGPKGMGMYNPTDNIKRKAKNTGESFSEIGQNKNAKKYTTSGSTMSQAHEASQQKKYDKEAKANVKTYSKEEIAAMNEARMKKDDAGHDPGSPEDSAHDVMEDHGDLQRELHGLDEDGKSVMLQHIRAYKKDPEGWKRSAKNKAKGKE